MLKRQTLTSLALPVLLAACAARPAGSPQPPADVPSGAWTLAVLPDTQYYARQYPGLLLLQTAWLAQQQGPRDIRFVVQVGDLTDDNSPAQWANVATAFHALQGRVPYAVAPGNHDYGPGGNATTRDTGLDGGLSFAEIAAQSTFGGAMEPGRLENTFHTFEAGGRQWLVLCLEWAPREVAVAWANEVMERHPEHLGILVVHAYLDHLDRRLDHTDPKGLAESNPHGTKTPGERYDGEELWQRLVRKHDFRLVLCGHVTGDGAGYLASRNDRGHVVHQMMTNHQFRQLGGEAWLRLLEFLPDGRTVRARTFSPLYGKYMTEAEQQFEFVMER